MVRRRGVRRAGRGDGRLRGSPGRRRIGQPSEGRAGEDRMEQVLFDAGPFECGTVQVPLDYNDPNGPNDPNGSNDARLRSRFKFGDIKSN